MPIYEYRCAACGFQKEYLQKMSDAPLTDCPECAKPSLSKMVTAAGFHLKGSGWYVTDFKPGSKPKADVAGKPGAKVEAKTAATGDAGAGDSKPVADKPAADNAAKKSESSPTAGAATGAAAGSTAASSNPASSAPARNS